MLLHHLPLLWLVVMAPPAVSPPRTPVSEAALKVLENTSASRMGVDRAGNLWSWRFGSGAFRLVSPAGEILRQGQTGGALAVDVDADWGVVGLFEVSREIRWSQGDLQPGRIRLEGPASDICWIGASLVAVAPQLAPHRIEIWNLRDGKRVKSMGWEIPVLPGVGATRLRGVLLRFDARTGLIHSLESFSGDLQVFHVDGRLAWQASVNNPEREKLEAWLKETDLNARRARDVQTPTLFPLKLALAPDGSPWVSQEIDIPHQRVTLVRVTPHDAQPSILRQQPCPSSSFLFWHDRLVLFRDPAAPQGACVSTRPR